MPNRGFLEGAFAQDLKIIAETFSLKTNLCLVSTINLIWQEKLGCSVEHNVKKIGTPKTIQIIL